MQSRNRRRQVHTGYVDVDNPFRIALRPVPFVETGFPNIDGAINCERMSSLVEQTLQSCRSKYHRSAHFKPRCQEDEATQLLRHEAGTVSRTDMTGSFASMVHHPSFARSRCLWPSRNCSLAHWTFHRSKLCCWISEKFSDAPMPRSAFCVVSDPLLVQISPTKAEPSRIEGDQRSISFRSYSKSIRAGDWRGRRQRRVSLQMKANRQSFHHK